MAEIAIPFFVSSDVLSGGLFFDQERDVTLHHRGFTASSDGGLERDVSFLTMKEYQGQLFAIEVFTSASDRRRVDLSR